MGRKNAATALDSFDKACNIGPIKFIRSAQALTSQPGHSFAARSMIDGGCTVSRSHFHSFHSFNVIYTQKKPFSKSKYIISNDNDKTLRIKT